jgi:predicted phosphoribosyltransferase
MLQQHSSEGLPGAVSKEQALIVARIYAAESPKHNDIGISYRQFEQLGREEVGECLAADRAQRWMSASV